eukprot:GHVU01028743.1.p4 GENE.GHVU01028743.1~~GHVU01028743.1.p4  ORF type:complete len:107 (+),score=7.43 GHVU01028743.1:953-1273(+)
MCVRVCVPHCGAGRWAAQPITNNGARRPTGGGKGGFADGSAEAGPLTPRRGRGRPDGGAIIRTVTPRHGTPFVIRQRAGDTAFEVEVFLPGRASTVSWLLLPPLLG